MFSEDEVRAKRDEINNAISSLSADGISSRILSEFVDSIDSLKTAWNSTGGEAAVSQMREVYDPLNADVQDLENLISQLKGCHVDYSFSGYEQDLINSYTPE